MKRYAIYLVVAALTFTAGVFVASLRFARSLQPIKYPTEVLPQAAIEPIYGQFDFAEVFREFDFVGSSSIDDNTPPHKTTEALHMPQTFETGNKYLFHLPHRSGLDAFYVALRDRLRAQGLNSSFSPSPNGIGHVCLHTDFKTYYMEYPLAEVRFEGRGYEGRIIMIPHPRASIADYVLVLEKTP